MIRLSIHDAIWEQKIVEIDEVKYCGIFTDARIQLDTVPDILNIYFIRYKDRGEIETSAMNEMIKTYNGLPQITSHEPITGYYETFLTTSKIDLDNNYVNIVNFPYRLDCGNENKFEFLDKLISERFEIHILDKGDERMYISKPNIQHRVEPIDARSKYRRQVRLNDAKLRRRSRKKIATPDANIYRI